MPLCCRSHCYQEGCTQQDQQQQQQQQHSSMVKRSSASQDSSSDSQQYQLFGKPCEGLMLQLKLHL